MGTEQERQKKEIDMMLNHEYPKCNIPFEPKPDEQPLPVSGEIRERIAKKLYEQEFSAGYWDVGMSKGDKIKWFSKADSILSDPVLAAHFRKGYVELDPSQDLPPFARIDDPEKPEVGRFYDGYLVSQQDMKAASFMKVKK